MERCPICRALLNGGDTCRRCRAELRQVLDMERRGRQLAGAAMACLAEGDLVAADRLVRRARQIHDTPEVRILARILKAGSRQPA